MKKLSLLLFITLVSATIYAQENDITVKKNTQFGITLGYVRATAKATAEDTSISSSNSEGGFIAGVSLNTQLSEKFYLQPSVQYSFIEDESFLFIPVMLKYYINDKFNIMIGPQGSFSFGDKRGLPINTFGLDASFGAGYDFNKNFYIEARYAFELTNRTPDGVSVEFINNEFDPAFNQNVDLITKLNTFHITVGYRFN